MNRYPLWKNALILLVLVAGFYYAAPNLYAPDPALQIAGASSAQEIDERVLARAEAALTEAGIRFFGEELQDQGKTALIRLADREDQLRAQASLARELGDGFIVALNLAPTTPDWLIQGGAAPMKLGLDLSGGVHFKLEVDVAAASERKLAQYETGIKKRLREERIRGRVSLEDGQVAMQFREEADREAARREVVDLYPELFLDRVEEGDDWLLYAQVTEQTLAEVVDYAVAQNLTTPITSAKKLVENRDQVLFLATDTMTNVPVGFIKFGPKDLYFYSRTGVVKNMHGQVCLLDFYVEESQQRRGCGIYLFREMLKYLNDPPPHFLAYDRPSPKLLSFMAKHFGLYSPDLQPNKYTIFEGFPL